MRTSLEAEVDRLFQLPLADFTTQRNALAKGAGKDRAPIKALSKPPVAAWAVNQLFWKDRSTYDALIEAAMELRGAHKAVLEGKPADLRSAGREHERTLDAALKATLRLMKEQGQPVTDATRHAILNTLRALPSEDTPGRLTRTLAPGGFEMLAGITPRPGTRAAPSGAAARPGQILNVPSRSRAGRGATRPNRSAEAAAERAAAKAREQRAAAERVVRDADQRARQAEFEAARTAREAARADKQMRDAREALEEARAAHEDAEHTATAAMRAREAAEKKVKEARAALAQARARLEAL